MKCWYSEASNKYLRSMKLSKTWNQRDALMYRVRCACVKHTSIQAVNGVTTFTLSKYVIRMATVSVSPEITSYYVREPPAKI